MNPVRFVEVIQVNPDHVVGLELAARLPGEPDVTCIQMASGACHRIQMKCSDVRALLEAIPE